MWHYQKLSWENLPRNRFWGGFLELQFADVIVDMSIMYPSGNVEKAVGCIWIWGIWERFYHHVFPTSSAHSFPLIYYLLEYDLATHSSTLAWKIPWTEKPGKLQPMGSLRAGHDWATSLSIFTFHFHALEKEMATHSSVLAWRIPGTGEPGGLPSMGTHRFGHDWSDLAAEYDLANNRLLALIVIITTVINLFAIWHCY